MEGIAVLACVCGCCGADGHAPEDTFDVCEGGGVGAGLGVGIEGRVALEVEVECYAAFLLGAEVGALDGVVFV